MQNKLKNNKKINLTLNKILQMQIMFLMMLFVFSAIKHYLNSFYDGIFIPLAMVVFLGIFFLYVYFISPKSQVYFNFFILLFVVVVYVFLQKSQNIWLDFWRLSASGIIPILGFWFFSPWLILIIGLSTLIGLEFVYFNDYSVYFHFIVWGYFVSLYFISFGLFYFDRLNLKFKALEAQKNNIDDIYTTDSFKKYLQAEFLRMKTTRKQAYYICVDLIEQGIKTPRKDLLLYLETIKQSSKADEFIFKLTRNKLVIAALGNDKIQILKRKDELEQALQRHLKKVMKIEFNIVELDYQASDLDGFFDKIYALNT